MSMYWNGDKVTQPYLNGQKVIEAYWNGQKIFGASGELNYDYVFDTDLEPLCYNVWSDDPNRGNGWCNTWKRNNTIGYGAMANLNDSGWWYNVTALISPESDGVEFYHGSTSTYCGAMGTINIAGSTWYYNDYYGEAGTDQAPINYGAMTYIGKFATREALYTTILQLAGVIPS